MPAFGKSIRAAQLLISAFRFAPTLAATAIMVVHINGQELTLPAAASVSDALTAWNVNARKGVAVAVNGNVIPATQWADHVLSHNDKLMIIKATQGG